MNYKGKRVKRLGLEALVTIGLILAIFSLVFFSVTLILDGIMDYKAQKALEERKDPKVVYSEPGGPVPTSLKTNYHSIVETDPTLDYDWQYILCMVAAEIQTGSKENQMALAQCVRNTSERDGRPIGQVLQEDYSASPCDPSIVSDSIKDTCYRIFILHETVIPTNVEVMYNTSGGFYSTWHEQQQFEFQIENIKYFSYPIYNPINV